MTFLSVNINKVATLRNARGGNLPDVIKFAVDCENFGADGITVHPRPDERHIRYSDVRELKKVLRKPFNIEGFPSDDFIRLILEIEPQQVTLVPDPPGAITSNAGWDIERHSDFLYKSIQQLKQSGALVSLFVEPDPGAMISAAQLGAQRVELYTERYAKAPPEEMHSVIQPCIKTAQSAQQNQMQVNAGHDLNLANLRFFSQSIPFLHEVSIGHALISDALYYGIENTIGMYQRNLVKS
jgi:pyridoxine 5-phosphate synthase